MEWMGKYKDISELVIKVFNEYASLNNKQLSFSGNSTLSFSEAQVIEEILRHKDPNMTKLAKALGVTKAAVTKTMKKLESKNFISRYKLLSNNKDILVSITDLGMKIYKEYQEYIYKILFRRVYQMLEENGLEYIDVFSKFFTSVDRSLHKITEEKL